MACPPSAVKHPVNYKARLRQEEEEDEGRKEDTGRKEGKTPAEQPVNLVSVSNRTVQGD